MENKMIVQYVRDAANQKIGVVVAVKLNEKQYNIGYSCVRREYGVTCDEFNKEFGLDIAIGRAMTPRKSNKEVIIPERVRRTIRAVEERAVKYFKGMSKHSF